MKMHMGRMVCGLGVDLPGHVGFKAEVAFINRMNSLIKGVDHCRWVSFFRGPGALLPFSCQGHWVAG